MFNEVLELIKKEGDRKEFVHKGFKCLIIRHANFGSLCGYVKLPKIHKFRNKSSEEIEELTKYEIPSHGGLTFSGDIEGSHGWIGFDCAHACDLSPLLEMKMIEMHKEMGLDISETSTFQTYRDTDYVEKKLKELAEYLYTI